MASKNKKYKILLTGGGTSGSVTPLLAVAEDLTTQPPLLIRRGGVEVRFEFLWLGTKFGPEREMVASASSVRLSSPKSALGGIKFRAISGGKWRRYFSLKNLADIFKIKLGFWQAFFIMLKSRPNLVMSAGSFISVPVVWAAWLLGVPVLIHQQDIQPGLANKLMAPFAKVVTVTFEKSLNDYGKKAVWTGNPVRRSLALATRNPQPATFLEIKNNFPVLLVLGGGTGAIVINELVEKSLDELTKFCQIIHVTGKNKSNMSYELRVAGYEKYEFLNAEQMAGAMQAADLVVTRAGMGFLSELSFLGKPSIIIPISDSHQEANAKFFRDKKAAIVAKQKYLTPENFTHLVKDLLSDEKLLGQLATNMGKAMKPGANWEMVGVINKILK